MTDRNGRYLHWDQDGADRLADAVDALMLDLGLYTNVELEDRADASQPTISKLRGRYPATMLRSTARKVSKALWSDALTVERLAEGDGQPSEAALLRAEVAELRAELARLRRGTS